MQVQKIQQYKVQRQKAGRLAGLDTIRGITLLSMMLPLLHHGMIISGIPFSEAALSQTQSGGTPYGASHVATSNNQPTLSKAEQQIAFTQGKRLAELALKLAS